MYLFTRFLRASKSGYIFGKRQQMEQYYFERRRSIEAIWARILRACKILSNGQWNHIDTAAAPVHTRATKVHTKRPARLPKLLAFLRSKQENNKKFHHARHISLEILLSKRKCTREKVMWGV